MAKTIKGLSASPGVAIGPIWVYRPAEIFIDDGQTKHPEEEWILFLDATITARRQLQALEEKARREIGPAEAEIFAAHQMFLEDPDLQGMIEGLIREELLNAPASVQRAVEEYAGAFEEMDDAYFRERAADVRDVGARLIRCLLGIDHDLNSFPDRPVILVAEDLTPSDTVQFPKELLLGFCTMRGGPTSHTAILARSLGLPAVVSAPVDLDVLQDDTTVILDGGSGQIVIDPSQISLAKAAKMQEAWLAAEETALTAAHDPAITLDGQVIEIVANIGNVSDAHEALEKGAEGVGLFRTEFLFLDRADMPDEEEQFLAYRDIFRVMGERPMLVRTLDIGGDKSVSYIGFEEEQNPFLGWRGIRMMDDHPSVLLTQLRALLRAGVGCDLRIMVPMVATKKEAEFARSLLEKAQKQLREEGMEQAHKVQFGIMIEVPSAALMAAQIIDAVDFFSIGTNDLTQYTLAVDRTNERVAHLGSSFDPAVLKLIHMTIDAAHAKNKWVGMCGEFAGQPLAVPLLLGLGLDEFSMAPAAVPGIKELIRRLSVADCKIVAKKALGMGTADEVQAYLEKR